MAGSLASQIITAIGGPENVRSLTHCATRLRFELVDASKVDQNGLEHMQGVLGAVPQSGDRFQVVIGGGVATVYENIMHLPEMAGVGGASASGDGQKSNADVKAEARSKARGKVAWLDSFFEYLADSFRPILGVLLGASIIIALVNLLISLNVIPNDEASAGWVFVKAIWKGVFYFLPIMVAYNAAKKLKVDPWLGGAIMAILMTPQFTGLMDAKTTTCVENAALGTKSCTANIFGYDFIQGPMGVWNFACFGTTAGVLFLAVRDKDKAMRQTALGALAAGLLGGVSEPSLYGIHLRYKLIYKRMLVGCGLGGVVIAILGWLFPSVTAAGQTVHGVTTTTFAFTSLLTIPVFNQMWVYAVSIAVSFLTTFLLIITFDYRTPEQKAEVLARAAADQKAAVSSVEAEGAAPAVATATATAVATKTEAPAAATTTVVKAPVAGHVISLDETGDPVFASRALGEGVGIQPADSEVVAPVSGVLQTVAETGHAFGIKTDDGVEVLVHVGIDTVKMNGEGFDVKVKANEHVNAGDTLVVVDFDKVKEAGYSTTTLMTVLNTVAFASVAPKTGVDVKAGESVIDIQH